MATHTTNLTAPTTTTVLDENGRFIIYTDHQTQDLNITPGTASGDYLGQDTSIAFAFSTDNNHDLYPYDTSFLYALQETTDNIYFVQDVVSLCY